MWITHLNYSVYKKIAHYVTISKLCKLCKKDVYATIWPKDGQTQKSCKLCKNETGTKKSELRSCGRGYIITPTTTQLLLSLAMGAKNYLYIY